MPEAYFSIEWPDGEITRCYSPSTVIREYFRGGATLTIEDLTARSRKALERAGERVRRKYGFSCSSAAAELQDILSRSEKFRQQDEVKIVSVESV